MSSLIDRASTTTTTSPTPTTSTSVPPCSLVTPATKPPSKKDHSRRLYNHAHSLLSKIEKSMGVSENDSFSNPSIPSIPSIPSFATPATSPTTVTPTTAPTTATTTTANPTVEQEQANECLIYRFVGDIFKMVETEPDEITPELKQGAVAMVFNGYEQDEYKPHILNLVKYINGQSSLSDAAKLKIIHLDLSELLNEF